LYEHLVAAELCYHAAENNSSRVTAQLEAVLSAIEILALEAPARGIPGVRLVKKACPASIAFELKAKRY
jgi:hypothetical protein